MLKVNDAVWDGQYIKRVITVLSDTDVIAVWPDGNESSCNLKMLTGCNKIGRFKRTYWLGFLPRGWKFKAAKAKPSK